MSITTSRQNKSSEDISTKNMKSKQRVASVYDAVAGMFLSSLAFLQYLFHTGRVGSKGFLTNELKTSKYRDTLSSSTQSIPPEEVLFKRQNAPIRYEENDFYFAHEQLPKDRPLPDSDLLKAIHQYSSDFYASFYGDQARSDFRSMDGTALLAIGILLEEAMKESLGENGDMVFTEPEAYDIALPEQPTVRATVQGSVPIMDSPPYIGDESSDESDVGHLAKRFKPNL